MSYSGVVRAVLVALNAFTAVTAISGGIALASAAVATVAGLRRHRLVAQASALAGIVLMGWILGEVLIVRSSVARSWVKAGYFSVGLLLSTLGLVEWWWTTAGPAGADNRRLPS